MRQDEELPKRLLTDKEYMEYRKRVLSPEYLRPSLKMRYLHLFSYFFAATTTTYLVFLHDYGNNDHCFSGLRRWAKGRVDQFYTLSPEEEDQFRKRRGNAS